MAILTETLQPLDIFLRPGDYYFGDRDTCIRTTLGSCISITFWHPKLYVGGMCHFMLPERGRSRKVDIESSDGRYADEVLALLVRDIDLVGAAHKDYEVKLFGGGNMFPHSKVDLNMQVGHKNIVKARKLIKHYGFKSIAENVGEYGHRSIIFQIWNGDVWVKHSKI
jgi:chemotaxis protein CheD